MYPKNTKSKMLLLYGPEAENGKSTFQDLVHHMIGRDNTVASSLSQIESKHGASNLLGKLLVRIDELEDRSLDKANNTKSIITGGAIAVEEKFKTPTTMYPTQKIMASTNNFPRVYDQTDGF